MKNLCSICVFVFKCKIWIINHFVFHNCSFHSLWMGCARAHSLILVIKSALLIRIFARFTILFDAYSICRHRMCKHRFAPSSDCLVPFSIYKSYMHLHFVHVHVFCTCISISYMHSNFDLHCHLPLSHQLLWHYRF